MPDNTEQVANKTKTGHITVPVFESWQGFGRFLAVSKANETGAMILCFNEGYGLKTLRILLPGQLYEAEIAELLAEYPMTQEIVCIPIRSEEYQIVWKRNLRADAAPASGDGSIGGQERASTGAGVEPRNLSPDNPGGAS